MEPTVGVNYTTLKVTVKPEHFRDAPHGYRIALKSVIGDKPETPCVLTCALIDAFGSDRVGAVGAHLAYIGGSIYSIPEIWGRAHGEWYCSEIDKWSERAKESLEGIPTTEVILTLYRRNGDQSSVI